MNNIKLPVITPEQEEVIRSGNTVTNMDKLVIFNKAYGKHIMPTNNFTFKDDESVGNFLSAVMLGEWKVDSGKRYINITEPMGISSFLYCKRNEKGKLIVDNMETAWDVVDYEQATLFTIEEIETVVPTFYTNPSMILTEEEAEKRWKIKEMGDELTVKSIRTNTAHISSATEKQNDAQQDVIRESLEIITRTEKQFDAAPTNPALENKVDSKVKARIRPV
ncbi:TPA: hypothetical protein ACGOR8_001989 [Streptococcus suis]